MRVGIFSIFYECVLSYSVICSNVCFFGVLYMLRLVWKPHCFPLMDIVVVPVL
jgi:hypothetical protein